MIITNILLGHINERHSEYKGFPLFKQEIVFRITNAGNTLDTNVVNALVKHGKQVEFYPDFERNEEPTAFYPEENDTLLAIETTRLYNILKRHKNNPDNDYFRYKLLLSTLEKVIEEDNWCDYTLIYYS